MLEYAMATGFKTTRWGRTEQIPPDSWRGSWFHLPLSLTTLTRPSPCMDLFIIFGILRQCCLEVQAGFELMTLLSPSLVLGFQAIL